MQFQGSSSIFLRWNFIPMISFIIAEIFFFDKASSKIVENTMNQSWNMVHIHEISLSNLINLMKSDPKKLAGISCWQMGKTTWYGLIWLASTQNPPQSIGGASYPIFSLPIFVNQNLYDTPPFIWPPVFFWPLRPLAELIWWPFLILCGTPFLTLPHLRPFGVPEGQRMVMWGGGDSFVWNQKKSTRRVWWWPRPPLPTQNGRGGCGPTRHL